MPARDAATDPGAGPLPVLAVSAAVWRDGRVLLAQRGRAPLKGKWSLPGGRVQPGETLVRAVARELMEETGVTAALEGPAHWHEIIGRDGAGGLAHHYVIAVFTGPWQAGAARAGDDAAAIAWATRDELASFDLTDGTADIVARLAP